MSIIAGLDIGSTKVAEVIARIAPSGDIEIIGIGEAPCQGLRRGLVTDIDSVAGAIKLANKRACHTARLDVRRVYVGVPATHITSVGSRGVTAVSSPDGVITSADVKRALDAAGVLAVPSDREIISVLPREYIVDGVGGIRDPEGMTGIRLEVDARVIMGQATVLENITASVARAGLAIGGLVLDPIAVAEAVLTPDEMERGVILVDVGGQITQVVSFCEGGPVQFAWVPAGGVHVTNDIAVGMKVPVEQAESMKKQGELADSLLQTIIDARLREILELVDVETREVRNKGLAPCGLVFAGGGSLIPGLLDLAGEILGLPARIGGPVDTKSPRGRDGQRLSSTALGIVEYVANDSVFGLSREMKPSPVREMFSAVRGWFADFVKDFF
ncbi:MAG: cell division protein FtsA [Bacillota bacterium]